jgi:D-alanyl-D-alanine carboxypeptidase
MRNISAVVLLMALAALLQFNPSSQRASAAEPPQKLDLAAIDATIADYVREKGLVGLSVAMMRDGEIVLAKGYGQRSIDGSLPVEPETTFAVGSVTKQFTCACILLLAEEGKLSVDDPVAKYYPNLTRASDITLRDLMNHTSGYPDYYPLDFVDRRLAKPISQDDLLAQYAGGKLDFEPGSRYSYSNTGYILLGGVVEKVSGQKFGDFLTSRILQPVGLKHSQFGSGAGLASVATGYNGFALGDAEPAAAEGTGWIDAAGGLWASAPDLLRWNLALHGGKVLRPASYETMTAPRLLTTGKRSYYGCGLRIGDHTGDAILQHTGGVSGFAAYASFLPRTRSGLVVLSNTEHISAIPLRTKLFELLLDDIEAREAVAVPEIAGPDPKTVVAEFFKQMQAGQVDRSRLSEEFNLLMTDKKVQSAAGRLKELGEPKSITIDSPAERGGMRVDTVRLSFPNVELRAALYRMPDGKIEQLLFYRE